MIDFTNCQQKKKAYSGANGNKLSIIYNNELYMLKFPSEAKKNPELSYSNSCISEYIGCKIFDSVGIPTQEVLLGTFNSVKGQKVVVACKDFTVNGDTLQDFASLKNGIKSLENNVELKKTNTRRKRNKKSKEAPKTQTQKEKEIITKNPEDDPNGINKFNFVKISSDKNEQIIPSGSNFSIMLPNIGVTLKEDDQIKEGTREFGKYFKKYSINDYDKILRDYLPLQNKTMLKNKMGQTTNTINNMNLTSVNKKIPSNMSYKYNSTNSLGNNNTSINNNININLPFTQTQNFNTVTELTNPLMNQQEMIQENDTNTNINNKN